MIRATWYEGTAQLLSLTELKSHLFELYFIGWTIKPMKVGRKPEYPEKTPGDELQKIQAKVVSNFHLASYHSVVGFDLLAPWSWSVLMFWNLLHVLQPDPPSILFSLTLCGCLCLFLSVCLSVSLCLCQSQFVFQSLFPSVCLSLCLSFYFYLSISLIKENKCKRCELIISSLSPQIQNKKKSIQQPPPPKKLDPQDVKQFLLDRRQHRMEAEAYDAEPEEEDAATIEEHLTKMAEEKHLQMGEGEEKEEGEVEEKDKEPPLHVKAVKEVHWFLFLLVTLSNYLLKIEIIYSSLLNLLLQQHRNTDSHSLTFSVSLCGSSMHPTCMGTLLSCVIWRKKSCIWIREEGEGGGEKITWRLQPPSFRRFFPKQWQCLIHPTLPFRPLPHPYLFPQYTVLYCPGEVESITGPEWIPSRPEDPIEHIKL